MRYIFRNGSWFDNLAASERSRGARRHAMLIEECIGVDGDILSQVLLPVLNIDRRAMDGTMQPSETLNKSQLYIKIFCKKLLFNLFCKYKEEIIYVLYLQN